MDSLLKRAQRAFWAAVLGAFGVAGCGGSGSTPPTSGPPAPLPDTGTLLVTLTDAEGDFVSYSVDVLAVTLQRRGGATVEVLPAATRVDFAQLTELSDLLAAATLAPGDIVGGKIRLDYANAEIFVEAGDEVVRANAVDKDGAALGIAEIDIELAAREHLVITRGRAALLVLDFDLQASHDVDLTQSPPVVTVEPFVVAEVAPVAEKELRLRGGLVSTDLGAGTYTVDVRPWFRAEGAHGRVTVHTTAGTSFEVDGVAATGAAGLAALAAKPPGTMTVAFGTLSAQERTFTAEIVHAGDSVSGERLDAVHGNIVARNGDQLTLKGAFAVRRDRITRLHRTVLVAVGDNTKILKPGFDDPALDAQALSVGQRIVAFGTLTEPATASAPATFDATDGRVRMLPTRLQGAVNAVLPGQLSLELRGIDRLGIALFNFAGTGVTAAQDANPADYEVATGTLSLANVTVGEPARVVGFVQPFGSAPPDFEGRTVVDHRELRAVLGIGWGPLGTTAPFSSMGVDGLVLDLGNPSIGERHALWIGNRRIDLATLPAAPTLAPPASGRALYGIAAGGNIRLFATFAELSTELAALLGGGQAAVSLTASGSFDPVSTTLRATHIAVHVAEN